MPNFQFLTKVLKLPKFKFSTKFSKSPTISCKIALWSKWKYLTIFENYIYSPLLNVFEFLWIMMLLSVDFPFSRVDSWGVEFYSYMRVITRFHFDMREIFSISLRACPKKLRHIISYGIECQTIRFSIFEENSILTLILILTKFRFLTKRSTFDQLLIFD